MKPAVKAARKAPRAAARATGRAGAGATEKTVTEKVPTAPAPSPAKARGRPRSVVVQAKKPPAAPAPVAAPEDPAPKGQRGGQNRFEPTADQAKVVRAMAAYGIPQDKIAQAIGISKPTLEKHFRETLDIAMTEANAKVAETLFKMATSGTVVAATIYWTKARMGWRDVQAIQQLDENGNPIAPGATFVLKIER